MLEFYYSNEYSHVPADGAWLPKSSMQALNDYVQKVTPAFDVAKEIDSVGIKPSCFPSVILLNAEGKPYAKAQQESLWSDRARWVDDTILILRPSRAQGMLWCTVQLQWYDKYSGDTVGLDVSVQLSVPADAGKEQNDVQDKV